MAKIIDFRTKKVIADLPSEPRYREMDYIQLITEFNKYPELAQVPVELARALYVKARTEEERLSCVKRMNMGA